MKRLENAESSNTAALRLTLTGLMGALVYVATLFFKIEIVLPGDKTMVSFANVFCILSGLLLGPVYGGLAAGIGSGIFDLTGGWASSAPFTFFSKFMMAFVCGLIVWGGDHTAKKLPRVITGAVAGSLTYFVLYIGYSYIKNIIVGSAPEAAFLLVLPKMAASITNAIVADVIAIPFFVAVRGSLERNHFLLGGFRFKRNSSSAKNA